MIPNPTPTIDPHTATPRTYPSDERRCPSPATMALAQCAASTCAAATTIGSSVESRNPGARSMGTAPCSADRARFCAWSLPPSGSWRAPRFRTGLRDRVCVCVCVCVLLALCVCVVPGVQAGRQAGGETGRHRQRRAHLHQWQPSTARSPQGRVVLEDAVQQFEARARAELLAHRLDQLVRGLDHARTLRAGEQREG
jgi:hypothetical protein